MFLSIFLNCIQVRGVLRTLHVRVCLCALRLLGHSMGVCKKSLAEPMRHILRLSCFSFHHDRMQLEPFGSTLCSPEHASEKKETEFLRVGDRNVNHGSSLPLHAVNELGCIYVLIITNINEAFMTKHIRADLFTFVDICSVAKCDNHFSSVFLIQMHSVSTKNGEIK